MSRHFLLQILQANCSLLPDGCVLTLTLQLCIRCIHIGTLSGPKESQPRRWVSGKSLEGSQRLRPRTSALHTTPQLSSGTLPGFTTITLGSQCPHLLPHWFPRMEVRHGDPGALGRLACRVQGPLAQAQPWKWEICQRKPGLILSSSGSLVPPAAWALTFLWTGGGGGCPVSSCGPLLPSTTGRGREVQRGWKACLHLWAPRHSHPRPVQVRTSWGTWGQTGCGPWGSATTPWGSHGHGPVARGKPLHGPGSDVSRQGSEGLSAQTWGLSSFFLCYV